MKKTTIRTYFVLAIVSCFSFFATSQITAPVDKEINEQSTSVTDSIPNYTNTPDLRTPEEIAEFGAITSRNCGCDVSNLLPDGDFESGLAVTSGLGVNCTCAVASVCVGHEPRDKCNNSLWINDLWDHALGTSSGNFLIVDGGNGSVWSETVPVTSGQDYVFSFWEIREVSDNTSGNNSTQDFDLRVNGTTIASFNTASAPEDVWTQYCTTWTSTFTSGSATIEIVQTSGSGYNDYGIDDIEFGECIPPCEIPELEDYFSYSISEKDCFKHKFTTLTTASNLCYVWYVDGVNVGTGSTFGYAFPEDGVCEVCVRIYCCDDPDVPTVSYCETIYVNCKKDKCGCEVNDQLPNGDFENTSIGISSGLPITCTCSTGSVCVGHEPRDKCNNSFWINDLWDHTFGTSAGHFLIVDGANGTIWRDNVSVSAGSTYIFEFWEIREVSDNASNNSTQTLDLVIDGTVIGTFSTAGAPEDEWVKYCASWIATYSSSTVVIEIRQTAGTGFNDYGIDDIQFGKCLGTKMNTASVIEEAPVELKLYPNPAVNNITLEWTGNLEINEISIFNTDGKLVKTMLVDSQGNTTIDVSDLTDGVYLLRTDANNIERFVVKK